MMSTVVLLVIEAIFVVGLIFFKGVTSVTSVISFVNMNLVPGVILVANVAMFVGYIEF